MPRSPEIINPSLKEQMDKLLDQMKEAGFSAGSRKSCMMKLRPIQTYMHEKCIVDYIPEVGIKYIDYYQKKYHCDKQNAIQIQRYVSLLNDCFEGKSIVRKKTAEIHNSSLNQIVTGLTDQLKTEGYSAATITNYYNRLRPIQDYMRNNDISIYSPETGLRYYEDYLSRNHPGAVQKREILAAILRLNDYCVGASYIVKHSFSDSAVIPETFSVDVQRFFSSPSIVSVEKSTIQRRTKALSRFLEKCIKCGTPNVKSLTPQTVLLSCKDVTDIDEWITIRQFLRFLAEEGRTENDLSTFVPKGRREIRVPSTYSIDEMQSMESVVDRSTFQGKRDYVVLLLADRLAIRSGDIAAMKLHNLDFEKDSINFVQKKTNNEITLPIIPELKEALKEYLTEANTEDGNLFHTLHAPYHPLRNQAVNGIINKYFKLAGINTSGKKHGPHSLRASVSTSMINDDIPYEAVRDVLGHTSPNSIRRYAKNDIEKLRRCAIAVPAPSGKFLTFLEGGAVK